MSLWEPFLSEGNLMIIKNKKFVNFIKSFIEQRPFFWNLAWRFIHLNDIFLPHDPTYYALKLLINTKDDLIIDIGANTGISALSFRKLCPSNRIISFEPNIAHEDNLKSIKKRIGNYEYELFGLGDKDDEFNLYIPKYKNIFLHTFSSIQKKSLLNALNNHFNKKVLSKISIEVMRCKIKTLDSYNFSPSLIKIDVEGFEENVLRGSINTLRKHMPSLIFEVCHGSLKEISSFLRGLGYEILNFDNQNNCFKLHCDEDLISNVSGLRNLIAVEKSKSMQLPIIGRS